MKEKESRQITSWSLCRFTYQGSEWNVYKYVITSVITATNGSSHYQNILNILENQWRDQEPQSAGWNQNMADSLDCNGHHHQLSISYIWNACTKMGYINLTITKLPSTETHPKLRFTNNKHKSVINDSLYFKRSHIKRQCIPFTKTKKEKKKGKRLRPTPSNYKSMLQHTGVPISVFAVCWGGAGTRAGLGARARAGTGAGRLFVLSRCRWTRARSGAGLGARLGAGRGSGWGLAPSWRLLLGSPAGGSGSAPGAVAAPGATLWAGVAAGARAAFAVTAGGERESAITTQCFCFSK